MGQSLFITWTRERREEECGGFWGITVFGEEGISRR